MKAGTISFLRCQKKHTQGRSQLSKQKSSQQRGKREGKRSSGFYDSVTRLLKGLNKEYEEKAGKRGSSGRKRKEASGIEARGNRQPRTSRLWGGELGSVGGGADWGANQRIPSSRKHKAREKARKEAWFWEQEEEKGEGIRHT